MSVQSRTATVEKSKHQNILFVCGTLWFSTTATETEKKNEHKFVILAARLLVAVSVCIGTVYAHPSLACTNAPHESFVRNTRGCPYYYVCMNGVAISQRCPGRLHFDVQGKCNFPEHVDCGACSPFGFQSIRYPGSCRRYIECNNGGRTVRECSEGLYFDTDRGSCNLEQLVNCTSQPGYFLI